MRYSSILIALLFANILVAQQSNLKIAPTAADCKELSDDQKSDCTDSHLREILFHTLDQDDCAINDSSRHYRLSFQVSDRGKVNDIGVYSYQDTMSDCLIRFQQNAQSIADQVLFEPSKDKKGNSVSAKKYLSWSHPGLAYTDTTGAKVKFVEEMPRFRGCEELIGNHADKQACSDQFLLQFLYSHLKYPKSAVENDVQGFVVAEFVVEKTGMLDSIRVIRDIGQGCGDAVVEALSAMNDLNPPFRPGIQKGVPVRVLYTIPVRFILEDGRKKKKNRKN